MNNITQFLKERVGKKSVLGVFKRTRKLESVVEEKIRPFFTNSVRARRISGIFQIFLAIFSQGDKGL